MKTLWMAVLIVGVTACDGSNAGIDSSTAGDLGDAQDLARPTETMDLARPTEPFDLARPTETMDLARPTEPTDLARPTEPTDLGPPTDLAAVDLHVASDMAIPSDFAVAKDFSAPNDLAHADLAHEDLAHADLAQAPPADMAGTCSSGTVDDVITVAVSGTVTLNGAQPTSACSSADRATVTFDDDTRNYHFSFPVPCNGTTTPFTFAGVVYPGTYRIAVTGAYSNIPAQPYSYATARAIIAPTTLAIDVTTAPVSGTVTLNGAQPTSACSSADRATVTFDDDTRNYHFSFPVPCNGTTTPFTFTGVVYPGTYRIAVTGAYSNIPSQPYRYQSARTISGSTTLAIDVPTVTVSGTVTLNGMQPTSACSSADRATVLFDDDADNYHFSFPVPCNGTTTPFTFTGVVYSGSYRMTVKGGYSNIPAQPYLYDTARTIAANAIFAIDVPTVTASGTVTINGIQPTSACSSADRATVTLDDDARNYHFSFPVPCNGTTTPFTFTGVVYAGTYRIAVTGGYSNIPAQPYLYTSALAINANTTLPIDVSTITTSGTVTLDGAQPTSACSSADRATIALDDVAHNYHFSFPVPCNGTTTPFTFTGVMYPGTYRITVTGAYSNIPAQPYLYNVSKALNANTSLTIDVPTRSLCGTITLNGAGPTSACSSADRATVMYDDNANGYHFSFPVRCGGPFVWTGTVYPGNYRVAVAGGYSNIPAQPYLIATGRTVP